MDREPNRGNEELARRSIDVDAHDFERLKGDQMGRAMTHMGEHIADLRNPEAGIEAAGPYQLEFRSWFTTVLGAIGAGQKNLTISGGYLVWSSAWSGESINTNTYNALTNYLTEDAMLSR